MKTVELKWIEDDNGELVECTYQESITMPGWKRMLLQKGSREQEYNFIK